MDYLTTYPATTRAPLDAKLRRDLEVAAKLTPLYQLPPVEARQAYEQRSAARPPLADPVARVADATIPGPAGKVPVRVYTPNGNGPFPVLVFIHGGGWVIGSLQTHDDLCRSLCSRAGALVVAVAYRLAPEHRFPAGLDDCYAALQWCGANAAEFGGDPRRLAVAGDSAGGNLSAAVSLCARDRGGPKLALQVLIYPVTHAGVDTVSYHESAVAYGLTRDAMIYYWKSYLAQLDDGDQPYASPLLARDLAGLPPALIVTADYDVLRDDGEAYAVRLAQAGVPVQCTRYLGMNHGFIQCGALYEPARRGVQEIADALRQAFSTQP